MKIIERTSIERSTGLPREKHRHSVVIGETTRQQLGCDKNNAITIIVSGSIRRSRGKEGASKGEISWKLRALTSERQRDNLQGVMK